MSRYLGSVATLGLGLVRFLALVGALGIFVPGFAWGQTLKESDGDGRQASAASTYFTDVVLLNQDGHPMRFYSDLLQGKIVVIDTIFTTCTGICPVMSRTFSILQDHLGRRLGDDVRLISISVDPENDTPERLKEFGNRFGARAGWYFLTGEKDTVRFVLGKLGQLVDSKEDHQAIFLIGNEPTGLWKKAFGLSDPKRIVAIVDSVIRDELSISGVGRSNKPH